MIVLALPIPPSNNGLYVYRRDGRGQRKTERYRTWIRAAKNVATVQPQQKIIGNYELAIYCGKPRARAPDVGNLEKAASDFLKICELIEDDRMASKVTIMWADFVPAKTVVLVVKPSTEIQQIPPAEARIILDAMTAGGRAYFNEVAG